MKKIYVLLLACCMVMSLYATPLELDPEEVLADTMYAREDHTMPSYIAFLVAKRAAVADPTQANLQALVDKVAALRPKEDPYNMVATINGDPKTRMGFCWFTNDGVLDGEVQLVAKENAEESDFETDAITFAATPTQTKKICYTGIASYIVTATGLPVKEKLRYISHKALAEDLMPGTAYSWRVGYEGHWSPIAHFRTEDEHQGEFSFLYMTDSHLMNPTYINDARRCAIAAVNTVPDAKFCVFPGDFVEDGAALNSEWEWERWFEESLEPVIKMMPIVPTDGNHDDSQNLNYTYHFNTDNTFKEVYKKPQFDGIIYSFVYGDALFLVFSMQDYWRDDYTINGWSSTSTYLDGQLGPWFRSQVIANPDTKYRISLAHFNLFSGSDHSTDVAPPMFRACMLPVFKDCEVDVALQGHDHTYEVIGPVNPDDCTPILDAISDREIVEIDNNKNRTGYKGGTYRTDDGTFYFIGATCGHKRYYPHSRERMESEYTDNPNTLKDDKHHNIKNYFDLFTGMFGQPEAPSFTKVTVKEDCLEFNSYTAHSDGTATLFNTMRVVRTKEHSVPQGLETPEVIVNRNKFIENGMLFIRKNGHTYNAMGQVVSGR